MKASGTKKRDIKMKLFKFYTVLLIFIFSASGYFSSVCAETMEPAQERTPFEEDTEENPNPDLDGFISDDSSSSKENTIHVVIENQGTNDPVTENPDLNTDTASPDTGVSYGEVYSGGSESSSTGEKILHKPQLLLEDSNLSGQSLNAGSIKAMTVTFCNKSRSQNIFGLKVSLSTENKGIEFERNSFYVPRLTPGETTTLKQNITIAEDAPAGQAAITFSLDYEDSKATGATGTETLTFRITQPVRAELEASDIPSVFYTMDTVEIPVKTLNLGKDVIYNAKVTLTADGLSPKESVFLGNIEAGTAAEGTLRVYVKGISGNDDQITGNLRLTYEDSTGSSYEAVTDFRSEIKESQIQSLKVEENQEQTNSWWYSIIAVCAALLIFIILFLISRLHRKSVLLEEARKAASH